MKTTTLFTIILATLLLCSCLSNDLNLAIIEETDVNEEVDSILSPLEFLGRECNYITAESFGIDAANNLLLNQKRLFTSNSFILAVGTTDNYVNKQTRENLHMPHKLVFSGPSSPLPVLDSEMENTLRTTFEPQNSVELIEYRNEELTNIDITANKPLFGRLAGESLNDKFIVKRICGSINGIRHFPFFFNYNKEIITDGFYGISISQFLDYRPIAPAYMFFSLNETPAELPIENLVFNVTVTVKGKEPLSDSIDPISLVKN